MNAIFLWWLTLGALIGFVAAWVWDWLWFRARRRVVSVDVDTKVSTLASERDRLAADLRACGDRRGALEAELKSAQGELTTVRGQLNGAQGELATLRGQFGNAQNELNGLRAQVGELTTLRGQFGNAQNELNGLRAQVGELTTLRGQFGNAQNELSGLRAQVGELDGLRAQVGELEGLRARVGELEGDNARLRAELEAAKSAPTTLGATATTLSARAVGDGSDDKLVGALREYNVAMHDELDATRRTLARFAAGRGDPLIDIDGIGPVYQSRLYNAGVVSFDQVAAMHPERLRSLVAPNAVFDLDTGSWIEEARRFANLPSRDPLIDINGIGPVYEQRLLNAGVTSFEQLAGMAESEIRAIIKPEAWQQIEPASWIAEARTLAAQVRAGTYRKGEY